MLRWKYNSRDLKHSLLLKMIKTHIFISHPKQGPVVGRVPHKPANTEKEERFNLIWHKMLFTSYFLCVLRLTRVSPSLKESYIERGRVEVDKLEDEHLEDKGIVVLGLCSVHLWKRESEETKC